MTNENIFAQAVNVKRAKVAHKANANNLKKFDNVLRIVSKDEVAAMFSECEVRVDAFDAQIYTLEKIAKITQLAFDKFSKIDDLTFNTIALFETAKRFADANVKLTAYDLKCAVALERHMKVSDDKKALIARRADAYANDSTINAQSQSSRAALQALNILREVAKDCFVFNNNALAQKISERLSA